MSVQLRANQSTNDPRLDRIPQFDSRNMQYSISTLFTVEQRAPRSYTWRVPVNLDQHNEGACVGFGVSHELAARPVVVPGITDQFARQLYWDAQRRDPWEGGSYPGASPFYEGTSVLAGIQAAKALGHYREYRWAFDESDLASAVGYFGPTVIGVNWYTGMMRPDANGFILPTGSIEGGHCVIIYGVSIRLDLYKIWNSWGVGWGNLGAAFISRPDMARLLGEAGEACIPIRQKVEVQ